MQHMLLFDIEKCVGCRTCEIVCSLHHTGECSPARSLRRVLTFEEAGVFVPMGCLQCEDPPCEKACLIKAITKDERTGAVVTDHDKCFGCKLCMIQCPFGGTTIDPVYKVAVRCDLCEDDPQCVKLCPTGALEYIKADTYGMMKMKKSAEKISELLTAVIGSE